MSFGSHSGTESVPGSTVISFPTATPDHTATHTETVTNSNYMYLSSVSSLLLDTATTTQSPTVTNPDQAPTTLQISTVSPTSPPSTPPLPSGLPSVILPQPELDLGQVSNNYSCINIMFNQSMDWNWMARESTLQGQVFLYFPRDIATGLGIPGMHSGPSSGQDLIWITLQRQRC